jgi:hypothetical protein
MWWCVSETVRKVLHHKGRIEKQQREADQVQPTADYTTHEDNSYMMSGALPLPPSKHRSSNEDDLPHRLAKKKAARLSKEEEDEKK